MKIAIQMNYNEILKDFHQDSQISLNAVKKLKRDAFKKIDSNTNPYKI